MAYDESFRGYFPDTLDLLELRGATIFDFSPLHDEGLPPHVDVVYMGCGHPELYARELSQNDCLMLSLKGHVASGGRIYAECGGLAYLCQEIELSDGRRWPMAGVLPATALNDPTPSEPVPNEVRLSESNWLAAAGECWRGYLSPRWSLRTSGSFEHCGVALGHETDVVRSQQAVGSRMYLNFAAQTNLLDRFFFPRATSGEKRTSRPSPIA